jgi:putative autoinducer-2 (AI-2) aldolase
MTYNALQEGAAGVDMGRNIFQSDAPIAMIEAVRAVVHGGLNAKEAFQMYQDLKSRAGAGEK